MHRTNLFMAGLVVAVLGIAMCGCTSSQPATTPSAPSDQDSDTRNENMDHDDDEDEGHEHDGDVGVSDMDKMNEELAKLPEADRLAAEKQHMCPVSGEMLGAMGAPLRVAVKGRDVWLCCEGCKEKLLDNPNKYLAQLPK